MDIKLGIDKAVDAITDELKRVARPASSVVLAQVGATASTNDEAIGRIVALSARLILRSVKLEAPLMGFALPGSRALAHPGQRDPGRD